MSTIMDDFGKAKRDKVHVNVSHYASNGSTIDEDNYIGSGAIAVTFGQDNPNLVRISRMGEFSMKGLADAVALILQAKGYSKDGLEDFISKVRTGFELSGMLDALFNSLAKSPASIIDDILGENDENDEEDNTEDDEPCTCFFCTTMRGNENEEE